MDPRRGTYLSRLIRRGSGLALIARVSMVSMTRRQGFGWTEAFFAPPSVAEANLAM